MRFVLSKEEEEESVKIMYFVPCVIISCMQLLFDMFSTLMSLKLKLKVKTVNILMYGYNAGPPMAIPIYTVLPY